jgi:hypothetical protein
VKFTLERKVGGMKLDSHFACHPQTVKSQQAKSKELDVTLALLYFFTSQLITLSREA